MPAIGARIIVHDLSVARQKWGGQDSNLESLTYEASVFTDELLTTATGNRRFLANRVLFLYNLP